MTKSDHYHHHAVTNAVSNRDRHLSRNGVSTRDAVKRDGGGKANWGKLGDEILEEDPTNLHYDPQPEPAVKFVHRHEQI